MAAIREITVPETKPATEWVNGRALQKVSPAERHAHAQGAMVSALWAWAMASGAGRVGTEWEFRVTPPGDVSRPLVPDIAFVSFERLAADLEEAAQIPYLAPDVAVEVTSPNDRRPDIDEKIRVYLAAGAKLVLMIDPKARTFTAHDVDGIRKFSADEVFAHKALPDFSVKVESIFEPFRPRS